MLVIFSIEPGPIHLLTDNRNKCQIKTNLVRPLSYFDLWSGSFPHKLQFMIINNHLLVNSRWVKHDEKQYCYCDIKLWTESAAHDKSSTPTEPYSDINIVMLCARLCDQCRAEVRTLTSNQIFKLMCSTFSPNTSTHRQHKHLNKDTQNICNLHLHFMQVGCLIWSATCHRTSYTSSHPPATK